MPGRKGWSAMRIDSESAAFLCEARAAGASFGRVLTLGRQNLNVDRETLHGLAARHGLGAATADDAAHEYCEPFFERFLGAQAIDAVDHSAYEGAALVHDLNQPMPSEWEERYDAVVD